MGIVHFGLRKGIVLVMMFWTGVALGQYHVKPFDISKKITALHQTEDGYLLYGTDSGEFGSYDGLQFNREENLDAKIHSIDVVGEVVYLETSRGLYTIEEGRNKQLSRNNLDILGRSPDNSFLVTTDGVFLKSKSEYTPAKEEFFDINEIRYGSYFNLGDQDYFRADKKVYVKKNRWNEALIHADEDFDVIPWSSSKMIIADRNALFTFDRDGYVDTLMHE